MVVSSLTRSQTHEQGSMILWLFVAVALFGALSWAMMGNGRGSLSVIDGEKTKAAEIAQRDCGNTVAMALKRLTARGCERVSYRMDGASTDTPDGTCSLYHPQGGAVGKCQLDSAAFCNDNLYDLQLGEDCGGLVYIGTFAGHRSYTTLTDAGKTTWNKGVSVNYGPLSTNTSDGLANTNALLALSGGQEPYKAAQLCRGLGAEWYLPSVQELKAIMNLPRLLPTFPTGTGTWDKSYWSSTDKDTIRACGMRVQDAGTCGGWARNLVLNVRCVRR